MDFDFVGDRSSFSQIVDKSEVTLQIIDGAVYSKEVDVIFPLNNAFLHVVEDTAVFKLNMYSDILKRELNLTGDINNISEMIYGKGEKELSTEVNVYTPIIDLKHAIDIFGTDRKVITKVSREEVDDKMKNLISTLMNRFDPNINVAFDTFMINNKIALTEFSSGLHLENGNSLVLERTKFNFFQGSVGLNARFDLSHATVEPFSITVNTDEINLEKFLESIHYLGISNLKNAERISGKVTMDLNLSGVLEDLSLLTNKTDATIWFSIENLVARGIDELEKLSKRIYADELLYDLHFAPLTNTITLTGDRIEVPLMEVQSHIHNRTTKAFKQKLKSPT